MASNADQRPAKLNLGNLVLGSVDRVLAVSAEAPAQVSGFGISLMEWDRVEMGIFLQRR